MNRIEYVMSFVVWTVLDKTNEHQTNRFWLEFGVWPIRITSLAQSSGSKQQGYSHEGIKLRPGQCQCGSLAIWHDSEAHSFRTPVTDRVWRSPAASGSTHTEGDFEIHRRGDISALGWGARHRGCLRYHWSSYLKRNTAFPDHDLQIKDLA